MTNISNDVKCFELRIYSVVSRDIIEVVKYESLREIPNVLRPFFQILYTSKFFYSKFFIPQKFLHPWIFYTPEILTPLKFLHP